MPYILLYLGNEMDDETDKKIIPEPKLIFAPIFKIFKDEINAEVIQRVFTNEIDSPLINDINEKIKKQCGDLQNILGN